MSEKLFESRTHICHTFFALPPTNYERQTPFYGSSATTAFCILHATQQNTVGHFEKKPAHFSGNFRGLKKGI